MDVCEPAACACACAKVGVRDVLGSQPGGAPEEPGADVPRWPRTQSSVALQPALAVASVRPTVRVTPVPVASVLAGAEVKHEEAARGR